MLSIFLTQVKMKVLVLVTFLIFAVFQSSYYCAFPGEESEEPKCSLLQDVMIIAQSPPKGTTFSSNLRQIKRFFNTFAFIGGNCNRYSLNYADDLGNNMLDFKCNEFNCKLRVMNKFPRDDKSSTRPSKLNVINVLKKVDATFDPKNGGRKDATKLIVLILSPENDMKYRIADYTGNILENGYKIIAVSAGSESEDLGRITFDMTKTVRLQNYAELPPSQRKGRYSRYSFIKRLITDPSFKPPQASASIRSSQFNLDKAASVEENLSEDEICVYAVDIAFLIDSSFSIKLDYQKELVFVQRVANRFRISETGTHGGVVVFSDALNYTKVYIKLNDFQNTKDFNKAVKNAPFIGYRTRIDYAFQKVEKELFTLKGGARPNMKKIIFLITDGYQNPTFNRTSKKPFDPVKDSQAMYDSGIKFFVVGIGQDLNKKQLEEIARDKTKVYYANSIDQLISDEFIKQVSKKLCAGGKLPNITTRAPPKCNVTLPPVNSCSGVGGCSSCCGSRDIYINIFQANSGVHSVMQGMKLSNAGKAIDGKSMEKTKPSTDDEILAIIKSAIPNNEKLMHAIKRVLETNIVESVGVPGSVPFSDLKRKRRSLDMAASLQEKGDQLIRIAKLAGCKLYFQALKKQGLFEEVIRLFDNDQATIFCPTNEAFDRLYKSNSLSNEKSLLMNHIAFKQDISGFNFQTFSKGKITLSRKTNFQGQSLWYANDAEVLLKLTHGNNAQIIITKDFVRPSLITISDVLKSKANLSIFYHIWRRNSGLNLVNRTQVEKLCFKKDLCVPIADQMKVHIDKLLKLKQFTILAPVNEMFETMEKDKFKSLLSDVEQQKLFLLEHIYLGILRPHNVSDIQEMSHSMSSKHSVLSAMHRNDTFLLADATDKVMMAHKSVPVVEGVVHIVEDFKKM